MGKVSDSVRMFVCIGLGQRLSRLGEESGWWRERWVGPGKANRGFGAIYGPWAASIRAQLGERHTWAMLMTPPTAFAAALEAMVRACEESMLGFEGEI